MLKNKKNNFGGGKRIVMAERVLKEFYHGTQSPVDLTSVELDPLSHATGRTPLAAFYGSDIGPARGYAKNGGVGSPGAHLPEGTLYKFTAEFDSPSRIVDAYEIAPSSFVDFLRESLPESGTIHKSNLLTPDVPGADIIYNFREKFDETLANNKIVNPTYFEAMDALDTVHSVYKPIDYGGKTYRTQSAVAARRYGIDALTFTDIGGDDVIAMLDPHDVQSKVGRRNINYIEKVIDAQPATAGPNMEDLRARFKGSSGLETTEPSQAGLEFLEKEKIRVTAEREAKKIANDLARPATREAIEKEGYLYHFAPDKYAESIAEKGIISNKDPRASQGPGKIFYWTDPSEARQNAFVPDIGEGTLDLYRTKVTPEMLDSFQMDPMIGNKDGVARSVFFEADSFPAEKIGVRGVYDESTGGIKYQKLAHHSPEEIAGRHPSHRKPQPKPVAKVEISSDELYRKYLKHLGDVKSEGGVLKGDLDTGYRAFDHRTMSNEAIRRLSSEVGDGSTEAIEQTVKILDKNQVFVDEQIIREFEERAHRSR